MFWRFLNQNLQILKVLTRSCTIVLKEYNSLMILRCRVVALPDIFNICVDMYRTMTVKKSFGMEYVLCLVCESLEDFILLFYSSAIFIIAF